MVLNTHGSELPDRKARGGANCEGNMCYVLFFVIAFAMLGAQRLARYFEDHAPHHP